MILMGNIMEYLEWRGDLTMSQAPFNEVDNLILSHLAYANYENIVEGLYSNKRITVQQAAELFFQKYPEEVIKAQLTLTKMSAFLLRKVANTDRFKDVELANYVNIIDDREMKQFAAVTFYLTDGTVYVAFRGTDNTMVGWKENFNMTFMSPVPAQMEAVIYLREAVGGTYEKIRMGGHSKGGNLAAYAAVKSPLSLKERIIEVYNNDGPGFHRDIIESNEYQEMVGKIKTIVPESSIVGMMLEHEEDYVVVKSSQKVLLQHDPMSWEVLGNQFIHVEHVTKESKFLDVTLKSWLNKMTESQRSQFVDSLFIIFDATNVKTIEDLNQDRWRKVTEIIKVFNNMDPENKKVLTETFKLFFNETNRVYRESKKTEKMLNS